MQVLVRDCGVKQVTSRSIATASELCALGQCNATSLRRLRVKALRDAAGQGRSAVLNWLDELHRQSQHR